MSTPVRDANQPLNAQIINDGAGKQDAVDLGHGIFMSKDVSNLYLVLTGDGNVLINTGIIYSAAENKRRFDAVSDAPLRRCRSAMSSSAPPGVRRRAGACISARASCR
jgi:hypothetical protein